MSYLLLAPLAAVRRYPAFVMPPAEPVDISARAAGSFGTRRPFGEMAAIGG
jgi:hypothetical protein